jgi:hypothetical protein
MQEIKKAIKIHLGVYIVLHRISQNYQQYEYVTAMDNRVVLSKVLQSSVQHFSA